MSLINVNLGILAYSDAEASNQPQLRLADLKWSLLGLHTESVRNVSVALAPGESMTVFSSARSLTFNAGTFFQVTKHGDRMRINASIGQRIGRAIGQDATTVWTISRTDRVMRIEATAGTLPNLATVQVGDFIRLDSAFSPLNQGSHLILGKSATFVEVENPFAQAESATELISIYGSGPVQIGDVLDVTVPEFTFVNQGSFPVLDVTDSYIEVLNPSCYPQTVTGIVSGITVYPFSYKWMLLAVDRKVKVGLNGDLAQSIEVEPPVEGDINRTPGLMLKRGKVFEISIKNVGLKPVQGFALLAE